MSDPTAEGLPLGGAGPFIDCLIPAAIARLADRYAQIELEPLLVIAGLDNPCSRRRKIDLKDLLDEPWALPELDNVASALIADAFRSADITPPTPQVVSDSTTVRTRLVQTGRFLTFLPGSTLYFGAGRGRVKVSPVSF